MAAVELTWAQFEEIKSHFDAVAHAKLLGADEGELKNVIIASEWDATKVEFTLNLS